MKIIGLYKQEKINIIVYSRVGIQKVLKIWMFWDLQIKLGRLSNDIDLITKKLLE